jgi:hypothetical protein
VPIWCPYFVELFKFYTEWDMWFIDYLFPPTVKANHVFHVSLLKKYIHDSAHIIDWSVIQVELEGELFLEPQCILDKKEIPLRNRTIAQFKV